MRALITTVPFGAGDRLPLERLEAAGIEYVINPLNRRLKADELAEMIGPFELLIAGTEPITDVVIGRAERLKLISRVGIGLDSVDLLEAERRGIPVSYTPDAPAPAVAELTMGLMLSLLRGIHLANGEMHGRSWARRPGRRLSECVVGVIGVGRIGSRVIRHLQGFGPDEILLNDLEVKPLADQPTNVRWATKEEIFREADILTLHLPLTSQTQDLLTRETLRLMKSDAIVINTSRGGVVNEADLASVLRDGHLAGAALDVFCEEPYDGELCEIDRCLLTAHMGSMSADCRARMEIEATEEAIRLFRGEPLRGLVPAQEYELRRQLVMAGE